MPGERVKVDIDGRGVWLTHLDRVLFDSGFTKAEVVDYYTAVADVLLPHLADRPLTLIRYPQGVAAGGFFAKNAPTGTPNWVRRAPLATSDGDIDFVVAESRAALAWLANMSALELHIPLWTVDGTGAPRGYDRLVIDLDPGSGAGIAECAMLALALREALTTAGLTAVAKTSGGAGLHLLIPVAPTPVDEAVGFVRRLAEALAAAAPDLATAKLGEKERAGRVLLDWRQNVFRATTAAPYSLRAGSRPGVSTPVTWDEVAAAAAGMELIFDPDTVRRRIGSHGDLAAPLLAGERPTLPATGG